MQDVNAMLQKCIEDLRRIEIPISDSIDPNVTLKDVTGFAGSCSRRKPHHISISEHIVHDEKTLKDILYHELIHTCPDCMNHGKLFKHYMRIVNQQLGAHVVTRLDEATTQKCGLLDAKIQKAKYRVYCPNCGTLCYRERKSGVIKNPKRFNCMTCHSPVKVEVLH